MEIITDKKRNNIFLKELKENIDKVDDIDKSHYTCLSTAVSYKIFEAVKLLLDKGADVYHKNNDRKTPLFYAYFSPNEQVIKSINYLIKSNTKASKYKTKIRQLIKYCQNSLKSCIIDKN